MNNVEEMADVNQKKLFMDGVMKPKQSIGDKNKTGDKNKIPEGKLILVKTTINFMITLFLICVDYINYNHTNKYK